MLGDKRALLYRDFTGISASTRLVNDDTTILIAIGHQHPQFDVMSSRQAKFSSRRSNAAGSTSVLVAPFEVGYICHGVALSYRLAIRYNSDSWQVCKLLRTAWLIA